MRTMVTLKAMLSKRIRRAIILALTMLCTTVAIILILMVQVEEFSVLVFIVSKFIGIVVMVYAGVLLKALDIIK